MKALIDVGLDNGVPVSALLAKMMAGVGGSGGTGGSGGSGGGVTASVGGVAATVTVVASRGDTGGKSEGDRVKAKCTGWTKYYAGEITRVNSDGTYDIKFEDGERKQGVTEDQIEGGGGDRESRTSTSTRSLGDRVKAKCSGWTRYFSGEIIRVNSDGTYDIKFEDGERKRGIKEDQIEGGGGGDGVQVFLGGSCNPTTWREDYAVGSLRPTYR